MQSKKGLYLLIALIVTTLSFFFLLFYVHENTLENGILFKVSFEYENAKDISYNFYNQSGKIEKVEGDNSFLLEKTDYNSVKLLRKITKGLKETKEPKKEEGITIYNGQNKRYYLIPYNSPASIELSELIIDGYIHAEMKQKANKIIANELYLYSKEENYAWTNDGFADNIIHTYQCQNDKCKFIYVNKAEHETILWDGDYYYYNYMTRKKDKLNIEGNITSAHYLKMENRILGIELYNEKKEAAYYDLDQNAMLTDFQMHRFEVINDTFILEKNEEKQNEMTKYNLTVWNRTQKEIAYQNEYFAEPSSKYHVKELQNSNGTYYAILKTSGNEKNYEILDSEWQKIDIKEPINGITFGADGNFRIYNEENKTNYKIYQTTTQELTTSEEYKKVYGIEEGYIFVQTTKDEFGILDANEKRVASKSNWKKDVNIAKIEKKEDKLNIVFSDKSKISYNLTNQELEDE